MLNCLLNVLVPDVQTATLVSVSAAGLATVEPVNQIVWLAGLIFSVSCEFARKHFTGAKSAGIL